MRLKLSGSVYIKIFHKSADKQRQNSSKEASELKKDERAVYSFFKKNRKKIKKALRRHGFTYTNFALIIAVTGVVLIGQYRSVELSSQTIFSKISNNVSATPLDSISSADIAANIAKISDLPEAVSVANQADSYNAHLLSTNIDSTTVAKPQLVSGGLESRKDIVHYTSRAGDTISSVASKFNVTSNSIRWSNGLYREAIAVGTPLLIPPCNGIVYKVASGDTVDSIAAKYSADRAQIIAFNDVELSGLPIGDYIVIPDGTQPAVTYTSYYDSSAVYNFSPQWGGNGYTYGYCTYYAATRVSVPKNWGNANTWAYYARLSGWTVNSTPIPGAIAQSPYMSGLGHVAYVEAVSADGTMMKYSDMNALCGWNCVGYSDWVPISTYPNYIYH